MISDNYNDHQDDNSDSNDKPFWQPSPNAMGKQPSRDSFTSTLGKQVAASQLTPTSAQPLHPEYWEVYIVSEEENQCKPAPLASKQVLD